MRKYTFMERLRHLFGRWNDARLHFFALGTLIIVAVFFATSPDRQAACNQPTGKAEYAVSQYKPPESFWEKTEGDPVATFTGILALLTFILAAVAVFQIYFLKRADKTARVTADAAKLSADAARDSIRLAQNTAERQLRAYIYTNELTIIARVNDRTTSAAVQVQIKNFGSTPAYKVRHATCLKKLKHPLPEDFVVDSPENAVSEVGIAPSHVIYRRENLPDDPIFHLDDDEMYYIFGVIKYFDTFRNFERTTKYCLGIGIREFLNSPSVFPKLEDARVRGIPTEISGEAIFEVTAVHNEAD